LIKRIYEKFDGNTEVVATIINFETGNDVICRRQVQGGLPPLQNR
jgi:flavodoxin